MMIVLTNIQGERSKTTTIIITRRRIEKKVLNKYTKEKQGRCSSLYGKEDLHPKKLLDTHLPY